DIFLAGIDTGALTMIWEMTELVRNPRVMKKAQENIRATLGLKRERITEEDLGRVDYLMLIIKETFRLHPPVPFLLPRETTSHIKIQGYDIPPKTQIQVNVWTIGRDPERWTDPEEFIPERFTNSSVDFRGQHFELLPFGSGRRMCPAVTMGIATVELALLNLLYFFDWRLPDGMEVGDVDMEETGTLSIVKKLPLQLDVFIAGIDTSSVTMIWAMAELVRNPRVMKKAQEQIRTTLGLKRERITEDDLDKVDYLKLIIKETFRLHPALPFIIPRETMSHVKIQGYDIPPKTQIQVNVWTIGRDPKRWTDPEEFIPERFTNSSLDFRGQHFDLLPFGSGRRMCPAMPMGVATVELTLMNLLYFFDWRLPDGMKVEDIDMEEAGNISVVKKLPLQLVPVQYEH
ncbi:unnamed protein product, partial [Thlaspi arvense]